MKLSTLPAITRRRTPVVAATALIAAAALMLTACGGETTMESAAESAAAPASSAAAASPEAVAADFPTPNGGELNLYNWTDYISPDLLKRFESETGIKVNLDNYDSNETMLAKLQAGGANYDVIVPSDYMVAQMVELGLLQDVAPSSFPNGANIKPEFLDVYFDQGRQYTAPYMYGTTGIAYDPTKVGAEVTSWADFFSPDSPAVGKIGTLNDQVEVIHAALRAVGAQPCSLNKDDYVKVEELLAGWKPGVAVINSDGVIGRMASGEQTMHMMWNGAFTRAQADNPNLQYVYPKEGITLWQDNFAIPVGAQNVDNAKIFINWMMDPANIGEATNFVGYDNGITGSDAFMVSELSGNPAVVMPEEAKALAKPVPGCPVEAIDLYDQVWTNFKK
ncbi:MAG: extracellular solute-binding protein [Actinomycetales bacterium]|nr:extracellular solute-binding protein [Actinomycetales bacterium]